MKKPILLLGVLILLFSCNSKKKQSITLRFLTSKKYSYSTSPLAIPIGVKNLLTTINDEKFMIDDTAVSRQVKSTTIVIGSDQNQKKLHFVLLGDYMCLISYWENGIGSHDIIDLVEYNSNAIRESYVTNQHLDDTVKLKRYLETGPEPKK